MTGWLNFTRRPSATSRADRSVIPAGGNGTISRIGRVGKDCAAAAADTRTQPASAARRSRNLGRICFVTTGTSCVHDTRSFVVAAPGSAPQAGRLLGRGRHVLGVAAAVLMDALGGELQHPIGQRGEEVPVVRDEQHGALEL